MKRNGNWQKIFKET